MKSPELFSRLAVHGPRLVEDKLEARDASADVPARVLRLSIETMLEVPTPNLWEGSLSRIVDFGHAVGQELEMKALGAEHELMHGEAEKMGSAAGEARLSALPADRASLAHIGLRRVRSYRVAANNLRASDLRVGGAA